MMNTLRKCSKNRKQKLSKTSRRNSPNQTHRCHNGKVYELDECMQANFVYPETGKTLGSLCPGQLAAIRRIDDIEKKLAEMNR